MVTIAAKMKAQTDPHPSSNSAAFASLSLGGMAAARRPQPVFDLAASVDEMKARVATIPIYTVANKDNEFVLVSGENEGDKRQLGLFFFNKSDAQALVDKIHEQNPQLAKQSQVLEVSMDQVYSFSNGASEHAADGLAFRFMPDATQVKEAMQVFEDAGIDIPGFTGVPVFQADGLTVKTENARYTPIFLSKSDLDAAVNNAHSQRITQKVQVTQAKVDRAEHELGEATKQMQEAQSKSSKAKAQAEMANAQERLERYNERLNEVKSDSLPKVEVGTLEEVLTKMENDTEGKWAEVMFIPPGVTSN
ncbi:hypothetical protein WJX79_000007 [Trebouxia sp. C0005]